jgi:cytochrome d ubiquinol oxidase subunit I
LLAVISSWAQLSSGHFNAMMVAEHQPAKLAAFEGHFRPSEAGTELYLFGWPDETAEKVYGVSIPGMLSFLVYSDWTRPVPSLEEVEDRYDRPPVWLPFQTYHLMVSIGMIFIGATTLSCYWWCRGTLFQKRWVLWFFVFAVILAFIANECGWVSAEVGRQPWIVYPAAGPDGQLVGGLRTSDALSEAVTTEMVLGSLIMFGLLYLMLFVLWIFLLNRAIQQGPEAHETVEHPEGVREKMAAVISKKTSGDAAAD